MDMAELEKIFFSRLNSMTDGEIIELVQNAEPCGLINSSAEAYANRVLETQAPQRQLLKSSFNLGEFFVSEGLCYSNELLPHRNDINKNIKRQFKSPILSLNNIFDTASIDAVLIAA